MIRRLDVQTKIIQHLQELYSTTKIELEEVKANMKVLQQQVSKLCNQEPPEACYQQLESCNNRNSQIEAEIPVNAMPNTFATAVRQPVKKFTNTARIEKVQDAMKNAGGSVRVTGDKRISQPHEDSESVSVSALSSKNQEDQKQV